MTNRHYRSESSQDVLTAAAIEVINSLGTHATTSKEIALRAGYSRSFPNFRFGNKYSLMRCMICDFNEKWNKYVINEVKNQAGLKALYSFIYSTHHFFCENVPLTRAVFTIYLETFMSNYAIRAEIINQQYKLWESINFWMSRSIQSNEISSDIDSHAFAHQCITTLFGTSIEWLLDADPKEFGETWINIQYDILDRAADVS